MENKNPLFKEGDKVRHKSDNKGMVILEVMLNEDSIEYMCEWLEGSKPVIAKFKESSLEHRRRGLGYL